MPSIVVIAYRFLSADMVRTTLVIIETLTVTARIAEVVLEQERFILQIATAQVSDLEKISAGLSRLEGTKCSLFIDR